MRRGSIGTGIVAGRLRMKTAKVLKGYDTPPSAQLCLVRRRLATDLKETDIYQQKRILLPIGNCQLDHRQPEAVPPHFAACRNLVLTF